MTAIATKGRELHLSALPETSTYQVIDFLSQPTPVDVSDTLVYLWAGSTAEDADNSYSQQARILAALLHHPVNPFVMVDAMEAVAAIHKIEGGHDLQEMYGCANTDFNLDKWLDAEQQNLTCAIQAITAGVNR